jgi:1-acyl-sn-glycerol-3-phosphate acyltransferase
MERSLLWKTLQVPARIFTSVLFDLKVYGLENVPQTGGVLLVANHQSFLDPVLVGVRLRRPVSYMARSDLFEHPLLGWLIRSLHAFPVRRGEGDIGALRRCIQRLEEGYALNVYPEGTRTEDGSIGPLQKGIGIVLRKADVPVIPVAIDGSFMAWGKGRKIFRRWPVRLMYGKPLYFKDMRGDEMLEKLAAAMKELFNQLISVPPLDE